MLRIKLFYFYGKSGLVQYSYFSSYKSFNPFRLEFTNLQEESVAPNDLRSFKLKVYDYLSFNHTEFNLIFEPILHILNISRFIIIIDLTNINRLLCASGSQGAVKVQINHQYHWGGAC